VAPAETPGGKAGANQRVPLNIVIRVPVKAMSRWYQSQYARLTSRTLPSAMNRISGAPLISFRAMIVPWGSARGGASARVLGYRRDVESDFKDWPLFALDNNTLSDFLAGASQSLRIG
jgi:hypothetical protein